MSKWNSQSTSQSMSQDALPSVSQSVNEDASSIAISEISSTGSKPDYAEAVLSPELLAEIKTFLLENICSDADDKSNTDAGAHLWDEIPKVIAQKMQDQLIPVANFIYHKDHPLDAKIDFLSTEYATRKNKPGHPAPLILADITFRIDDREIYHLEFQIDLDGNISLRMLEYDFQIALQHDAQTPDYNHAATVAFPNSAVIYPVGGRDLPEYLECNLLFPDGTSHPYRVPTVDISKYKLKELFANQLNMFLPFSLLRFNNRLEYLHQLLKKLAEAVSGYEEGIHTTDIPALYAKCRNYADSLKKELTAYIQELILGLETEYDQKMLSKQHYDDYIRLIYLALMRMLNSHPVLRKEASQVTEAKIKLVSEIMQEKDDEIAKKDATIAEKDDEIAELKRQLAEAQKKLK